MFLTLEKKLSMEILTHMSPCFLRINSQKQALNIIKYMNVSVWYLPHSVNKVQLESSVKLLNSNKLHILSIVLHDHLQNWANSYTPAVYKLPIPSHLWLFFFILDNCSKYTTAHWYSQFLLPFMYREEFYCFALL